jgi:sec-independent protein translocase protein TatA
MGFFSAPGPLELLVILAVALIVLGPQRLPEAARSVGRGMREMRETLQGIGSDDEDDNRYRDELEDDEQPAAKPVP